MASAITGLILPGDNVLRSGAGTIANPYVISVPTLPPPAPPARSAAVAVTLVAPAIGGAGVPTVTLNGDGTASLNGAFQFPGPTTFGGGPYLFAVLPEGHRPQASLSLPTTGTLPTTGPTPGPVSVHIDVNSGGGQMFLSALDIPDGTSLWVTLDELRFWVAT